MPLQISYLKGHLASLWGWLQIAAFLRETATLIGGDGEGGPLDHELLDEAREHQLVLLLALPSELRLAALARQQARELLLRANLKLAVKIAHKYGWSEEEREEIRGECHLLMWRALPKYALGRGTRVSTYLWKICERRAWKVTGRFLETKQHQGFSLDAEVGSDEGDSTLGDLAAVFDIASPSFAEGLLDGEDRASLAQRLLTALSEEERHVVVLRLGLAGTEQEWEEVAEALNLTVPQAQALFRKAINHLRLVCQRQRVRPNGANMEKLAS